MNGSEELSDMCVFKERYFLRSLLIIIYIYIYLTGKSRNSFHFSFYYLVSNKQSYEM